MRLFGKRQSPEEKMREQLRQAVSAREHAENCLNEAVNGDLVDAAIFEMKAADLRLNNLMRASRQDYRAACGQ